MAVEIQQSVEVQAPIGLVWALLMSPQKLASCMPGASLTEVIDERQFKGDVCLSIGAITLQYQGTVTYTEVDTAQHSAVISAQAQDKTGGTVSATISTSLEEASEEITRAQVGASFNITGRLVQVGGGMIDGVSEEIVAEFIENVTAELHAQSSAGLRSGLAAESGAEPAERGKQGSIDILAVIWKVVANRLKRLLPGSAGDRK
ncbi:MAG: hypothetical protein CMQ20_08345 [Gammaproteobacteria bacterium]|jgi:hypothetical protein|nr:hypothetical protein [Gammaproteobacteria bacterium]|tara:strand:+ start:5098 stop:5709 length:612 start_codon:yes stop_codon:yes gene_type:complete